MLDAGWGLVGELLLHRLRHERVRNIAGAGELPICLTALINSLSEYSVIRCFVVLLMRLSELNTAMHYQRIPLWFLYK